MMKKLLSVSAFLMLMCSVCLASKETIRLATSENKPYIGKKLEQKGYVHELITEIFHRIGLNVEIRFFPWARALNLSKKGKYDGIMPIYDNNILTDHFVLSDPFPGGHIGLLKRKELKISYAIDPRKDPIKALRSLQEYKFGVVRNAVYTPEFDNADFLRKQEVTEYEQNLEKLYAERIDFAIIDKYTAADIMTHQRPHLIGQFEFMNPPLAEKSFHLAFSKAVKGYEKRVNAFNKGLEEVIQDGTLDKILSKHGLLETKEAESEKTTIRIGTVNNTEMKIMQRLSKEFEKQHPDINLEWVVLHENVLRQRLLSDLAIHDGKYDVMTIGIYEAPIWAKNGWLKPLNDLPADYDLDDVFESVRLGLSYQDKLYALPFYAESTMTFYRKDLFEQAGLTMPDHPTYEDILRLAANLHNPEQGVYGIGLRGKAGWGGNMAYITTLANTYGGRWFDEQWHPTLDSPEWREAITYYVDILKKYGHPNRVANGWQANEKLFADGQLAILIDATSFGGRLFNPAYSKVHDRIGTSQTPVAKTPKGANWLWAWSLAIPSSTQFSDKALKFITWATSKEYIKLVAKHEGWIAVPPGTRISTYKNPHYRAEAPFAEDTLMAMRSANPHDSTLKPTPYNGIQFVAIPEFPAIATQVGNLIADTLAGKLSVKQALLEAQKLTHKQMRASGYIK